MPRTYCLIPFAVRPFGRSEMAPSRRQPVFYPKSSTRSPLTARLPYKLSIPVRTHQRCQLGPSPLGMTSPWKRSCRRYPPLPPAPQEVFQD